MSFAFLAGVPVSRVILAYSYIIGWGRGNFRGKFKKSVRADKSRAAGQLKNPMGDPIGVNFDYSGLVFAYSTAAV